MLPNRRLRLVVACMLLCFGKSTEEPLEASHPTATIGIMNTNASTLAVLYGGLTILVGSGIGCNVAFDGLAVGSDPLLSSFHSTIQSPP